LPLDELVIVVARLAWREMRSLQASISIREEFLRVLFRLGKNNHAVLEVSLDPPVGHLFRCPHEVL
jgi:hypothetical protein